MGKVKKICRICGKEYTPCSYCENDQMAFHYRTICCSRDCAQKYLAKVLEARNKDKEVAQSIVEDVNDASKASQQVVEKPRRKYVKKRQEVNESERVEQIEKSEGTSD